MHSQVTSNATLTQNLDRILASASGTPTRVPEGYELAGHVVAYAVLTACMARDPAYRPEFVDVIGIVRGCVELKQVRCVCVCVCLCMCVCVRMYVCVCVCMSLSLWM